MKAAIFLALFLTSCAAVQPAKEPAKPAYAFPPDTVILCFEGYWTIYSVLADDARQFTAKCGPQI